MRAGWSIFGKDSKEMLVSNYSSYSEPIETSDTEALVAAQSRTVEHLSREIARALKTMAGREISGQ